MTFVKAPGGIIGQNLTILANRDDTKGDDRMMKLRTYRIRELIYSNVRKGNVYREL